jgi:outer membrane protein assembly factor BamB
VVYRPPNGGPAEVLISGAYRFTSHSLATGEKLWWFNGLSWQSKPTPVIGDGLIYVASWESGGDTATPPPTPTFEEALAQFDANKDGRIAKEEITDQRLLRAFAEYDLDMDLAYNARDWSFYRSRRASQNGVFAVRPGGRGDVTNTHIVWKQTRNVPNCPSPILHDGVLYLAKDGGIFTSLDAKTGEILKQGRLENAIGTYYSSPVLADGKIYIASEPGKLTVLKAAAQWEVLATNDLGEECYATPAIAEGRIYVRTKATLFCFAKK